MYSAVNKNTVQQCTTKVMADVINHMYFYYFYNVSDLLTTQSFPTPHCLQSW